MKIYNKTKTTVKHLICLISMVCLAHCGGSDGIEIPESTTSLTQEQVNDLAVGIFLTSTLFDDGFGNQWDNFDFNTGVDVLEVDIQNSNCAFSSSGT